MNLKIFKVAASGDVDFLNQVSDHKSDLDQVTPQKNTVLHIAVKHKQTKFAKQLLSLCPSLLLKANSKGDTPLHVAASIGCLEVAKLLIDCARKLKEDVENQEASVQKQFLKMVNKEKKDTALHVAVRYGHLNVVKLLMEADPGLSDLANNSDETPLHLAMMKGFSFIIDHILENSPLSSCGGTKGINALHLASYRPARQDIMRSLVMKRQDMIREADLLGWTPFHYAAYFGELEVIRLLLQYDSSAAYLCDKEGASPLHLAAFAGCEDIVRELIQCCPYSWELLDDKGRTAFHVAVIAGRKNMIKFMLQLPELADLINEPDNDGNTPLHLAVVHEKYAIISILARNKGVDKHAVNKEFFTAVDILPSKKEISFEVAKVNFLLRTSSGLPYFQNWVDKILRKKMKGEPVEKGRPVSVTKKQGYDEYQRTIYETHLLVAMLVATVAFAAAFTMPGGYVDEGPDEGMAIFIEKSAFKTFVVFDAIAFSFSVATVYLHFYASRGGYKRHPNILFLAAIFISMAMLGMVLAFVSGMFVMLSKSIGLALSALVISGCSTLCIFLYWFLDPGSIYLPGLTRCRRKMRNILFHYEII